MTPARGFILASGSERRRKLLADSGYEFEIISPRVNEATDEFLTLRELTTLNAIRKVRAVAAAYPGRVVLAADTLVALVGEIIGKPNDLVEAAEILQRLSGRVHDVCSSVAVVSGSGRRTHFHAISQVQFRVLTPHTIDTYLAKINPLDKAGAYAAQSHGSEVIAEIYGSFTNVVGLPMERTTLELRKLGIIPHR